MANRITKHKCLQVPHEFGRYQVESASAPGEHYLVDVLAVEETEFGKVLGTCPCEGWKYRKNCSHLVDAMAEHERRINLPIKKRRAR